MVARENQDINYITILNSNVEILEDGKRYNLCKCKCGNIKYILSHTLRTKRIRDCGCGTYMLEKHIGETVNDFIVIDAKRRRIGKNKKVNIICICKCKCGNIVEVCASNLSQKKISCPICLHSNSLLIHKGKTYGSLTILDVVDFDKKIVKCQCKCGNIIEKNIYKVTSPKYPIKHCNNCDKETKKNNPNPKQTYHNSRLKKIYYGMIARCYNNNNKDFKWYGQIGITVCDEWKNDSNSFCKWAIENGYKDNLTIDRINNSNGYSPDNCRWVDLKTQQNNRRNNVKYFFNNKFLTLSEISDVIGINYSTLNSRLRSGMSPEEAFSTPLMRRR